MQQHLCARYCQTLAAVPLFCHTKTLHTLVGMGSAALAAAVPYPGKATKISLNKEILKKKKYKKKEEKKEEINTTAASTYKNAIPSLTG